MLIILTAHLGAGLERDWGGLGFVNRRHEYVAGVISDARCKVTLDATNALQ